MTNFTTRNWFIVTLGCLAIAGIVLVAPGCGGSDAPPVAPVVDTAPPGVASVTPLDASHVEIVFDEDVIRDSAQRTENYLVIDRRPVPLAGASGIGADSDVGAGASARGVSDASGRGGLRARGGSDATGHGGLRARGETESFGPGPGDTLRVDSAVLAADDRTVTLSIAAQMSSFPYDVVVRNIDDLRGNRMPTDVVTRVTGDATLDTTAPEIVFKSPGASATGVAVRQSVIIQFSERMVSKSVGGAFSWTTGGVNVPYQLSQDTSTNTYAFTPILPLAIGTTYAVTVSGSAIDFLGNPLVADSWSFTTMPMLDTTPPQFTSSFPANGAVSVPLDVTLRLSFSEAIDQTIFDPIVTPETSDGVVVWKNAGATVTFQPDSPLMPSTQYFFVLSPDAIKDLAGNPLAQVVTIRFTTGSAFATGSFSGVVSGDPTSANAADPTGALVIASPDPTPSDTMEIFGSAAVAGGGAYSVGQLPDGRYWPLAFLDSNSDGMIDPSTGDAFGMFGVDFTQRPPASPDSVDIVGGGAVTNVSFQLFDPVAATGTVAYVGQTWAGQDLSFYVGIFDTTAFDTTGGVPEPDFGTLAQSILDDPFFWVDEIGDGLVPSVYYFAAYLDVNRNTMYDAGVDLGEFYEIGGAMAPVNMLAGRDALNIVFVLDDTSIAPVGPRTSWTTTPEDTEALRERRRIFGMMKRVLEEYQGARGQ